MPPVLQVLIDVTQKLGCSVHDRGTIVVIEGPRFSTKAESFMFRSFGASVIGMTAVPEVIHNAFIKHTESSKEIGEWYLLQGTDVECRLKREWLFDPRESVDGWRKNAVQRMSLALVDDRKAIWPLKSLHQLPYQRHFPCSPLPLLPSILLSWEEHCGMVLKRMYRERESRWNRLTQVLWEGWAINQCMWVCVASYTGWMPVVSWCQAIMSKHWRHIVLLYPILGLRHVCV